MQYKFKVLVKCKTFNQSAYIEDAMNGFVMQQTDFQFVSVIIDDASTDGEPEVINKYFQKYFELLSTDESDDYESSLGRHKNNLNCYFLVYFLKYNHFSIKKTREQYYAEYQNGTKYIALCEGDDYWTDETKIQRQVDFLDSHQDCSLTSENGIKLYTDTGKTALFSNEDVSYYSIDDLLIRRRFPTASVMYRAIYADELFKKKCNIDTIVWAFLSSKGRIHYDNSKVSSIYRRGPGITEKDKVRWAYICGDFSKRINVMFKPSVKVRLVRRKLMCLVYIKGVIDSAKRFLFIDFVKLLWRLCGTCVSLFTDMICCLFPTKKSKCLRSFLV